MFIFAIIDLNKKLLDFFRKAWKQTFLKNLSYIGQTSIGRQRVNGMQKSNIRGNKWHKNHRKKWKSLKVPWSSYKKTRFFPKNLSENKTSEWMEASKRFRIVIFAIKNPILKKNRIEN